MKHALDSRRPHESRIARPLKVTKRFVTVGNRRVRYYRAAKGPRRAAARVALLGKGAAPAAGSLRAALHRDRVRHAGVWPLATCCRSAAGNRGPGRRPRRHARRHGHRTCTAVYGRAYGAQIAVEFAARHPQRCAMALTDGFPIFSAETKKVRLQGLSRAHRAHLRRRAPGVAVVPLSHQHVFWPWNEQRLSHRADTDVPNLDFLHRGVIELLEAGDSYRVGYATAYRHRGLEALADLKVPVCFGARPGDNQLKTLQQPARRMDAGDAARSARGGKCRARGAGEASRRQRPPAAPACRLCPGTVRPPIRRRDGAQILVRQRRTPCRIRRRRAHHVPR